jgi:hypothetical protein
MVKIGINTEWGNRSDEFFLHRTSVVELLT